MVILLETSGFPCPVRGLLCVQLSFFLIFIGKNRHTMLRFIARRAAALPPLAAVGCAVRTAPAAVAPRVATAMAQRALVPCGMLRSTRTLLAAARAAKTAKPIAKQRKSQRTGHAPSARAVKATKKPRTTKRVSKAPKPAKRSARRASPEIGTAAWAENKGYHYV